MADLRRCVQEQACGRLFTPRNAGRLCAFWSTGAQVITVQLRTKTFDNRPLERMSMLRCCDCAVHIETESQPVGSASRQAWLHIRTIHPHSTESYS
jgi:hypothetical protein